MSEKNVRKIFVTVGVIAGAIVLIVLMVIVFALATFGRHLDSTRNALAKKYATVNLPNYLHFTNRKPEGDGVDSQPYWYYEYVSDKSAAVTSADLQTSLRSSQYTVSDVETKSDIAHDAGVSVSTVGTDYEFDATSTQSGLRLLVDIYQSKNITVTVQGIDL